MLWPLLGAAQAVFTVWNLAKFQDRAAPPASETALPASPDPRNLAAKNLAAPSLDPPPEGNLVSLLVPARNEAAHITDCLKALLAQTDIPCEILVLDDHSEDETAALVQAAAQGASQVTLIAGRPLEPGWTGKNWACAQLAEAAKGNWLVFIDADTTVAPGAIAAAVDLATAQQADLLSFFPRQTMPTPAEGALMPMLAFLLLAFLPVEWAQKHPDPRISAANGQFLMFSRRGYERCGGHAASADAIVEDVALARAIKASGGQLLLRDAGEYVTCRMYDSLKGIWDGFRKNIYPAFGAQPKPFALGLSLILFWHVLPPLGVLAGLLLNWPGLTTAGIVQTLVLIITRMVVAVRLGHPLWSPLLHPAAAAFVVAVALASYQGWNRGNIVWKGRRYGGATPLDLSSDAALKTPA